MKNFRLKSSHVFLVIFLLPVSGVFYTGSANPFGLPYFSELAIVVSFSFFLGGMLNGRRPSHLDVVVALTPVFWSLASAFNAYNEYGQPMLVGLLEERRMYFLYFYFPLRQYISRQKNSDQTVNVMLVLALCLVVLGFLHLIGLISGFGFREIVTNKFRADRASFATAYIVFAIAFTLTRPQFSEKIVLSTASIFLFVLFLLLVSQTRQFQLAAVLIIGFHYVAFQRVRVKVTLFLYGSILIPIFVGLYFLLEFSFLESPLTLINELFGDSYRENSVRTQSFATVFREFSFFGHGALMLSWNGGFAPYYGSNFFLADIGMVGTLHRFGVMSVPFFAHTLWLIYVGIKNGFRYHDRFTGEAILLCSLVLIVLWPVGGILENRAGLLAFLLAISVPRRIGR